MGLRFFGDYSRPFCCNDFTSARKPRLPSSGCLRPQVKPGGRRFSFTLHCTRTAHLNRTFRYRRSFAVGDGHSKRAQDRSERSSRGLRNRACRQPGCDSRRDSCCSRRRSFRRPPARRADSVAMPLQGSLKASVSSTVKITCIILPPSIMRHRNCALR